MNINQKQNPEMLCNLEEHPCVDFSAIESGEQSDIKPWVHITTPMTAVFEQAAEAVEKTFLRSENEGNITGLKSHQTRDVSR